MRGLSREVVDQIVKNVEDFPYGIDKAKILRLKLIDKRRRC
jgi:hypothetical protein